MRRRRERAHTSLDRAKKSGLEKVIDKLRDDDVGRQASGRQIERRRQELLTRYGDAATANRQLERILKGNDLTDVSYLLRGLDAARSVCRIVIRKEGRLVGYGTGFLVAPGVVMTNHHVLENEAEVAASSAEFDYERDLTGKPRTPVEFRLSVLPKPIIFRDLDFTLAAVSPVSTRGRSLSDFGWLKLNPQPGKAFIGEYLTIIQHPGGEPKQICVRENKLIKYDENGPYLWYQTDTTGGSSGSPVFSGDWDVVALHHSSVPKTKLVGGKQVWIALNGEPWTSEMGDDSVDWIANEGIRISRVIAYLRDMQGQSPIARAVIDSDTPPTSASADEGAWTGRITTQWGDDGIVRVRVPIELGVRVGIGPSTSPVAAISGGTDAAASAPIALLPASPSVIEKVVINQDNYSKRTGYDPHFLGRGATLPLPTVTDKKVAAQLFRAGRSAELKYWTYSVLFHQARKLAVVSAANVDPGKWRGNRDADGDTWYNDVRVDAKLQVGASFYKKQKTFEADRSLNPFDQGHLTRRSDVQWGDSEATAKRNGDDSYHYTNCAPQHWAFNQNNKDSGLWFRLETYAADASDGAPLTIFNGPIFDAPLCQTSGDGRPRLDPKGKRVPDGTFGGVKIPKQFFKVFAYKQGSKIKAAAFIVTQEDLLATIDRYYPEEAKKASTLSDLEVRLYRVPIETLSGLTGLGFGPLKDVDEVNESFVAHDGAPIESEAELGF